MRLLLYCITAGHGCPQDSLVTYMHTIKLADDYNGGIRDVQIPQVLGYRQLIRHSCPLLQSPNLVRFAISKRTPFRQEPAIFEL